MSHTEQSLFFQLPNTSSPKTTLPQIFSVRAAFSTLIFSVKPEEEQMKIMQRGLWQVARSCWTRGLEELRQGDKTKPNPPQKRDGKLGLGTEAEGWTRERDKHVEILAANYATLPETSSSHILILSLVKYTLCYSP